MSKLDTFFLILGAVALVVLAFAAYRNIRGSKPRRKKPAPQAQKVATPTVTTTLVTKTKRRGSWALWSVIGILIVALIIVGYYKIPDFRESGQSYLSDQSYTPRTSRLPAEIVLPIIADCESGNGTPGSGRQFDNKGRVIVGPTHDYGKWQIHLPTHGKEINEKAINIWTEEGNKQFARILYERNELADWQATRHCWEPKLIALGGKMGNVRKYIAKTDEPFTLVIPPGWKWEIVGEIPTTYTTDNGYRDANHNRIQVFEVVPPATEVALFIELSPCHPKCIW